MTRLFFISFLFLQACCGSNYVRNSGDGDRILGVKISRLFPALNEKGEVDKYDPFDTKIFYYADQMIYQTYYHHNIFNLDISDTPTYRYDYRLFIFSKNSKEGVLIDSNNLQTARTVRTDSMLATEWANQINFKWIFDDNYTTLVSSKYQLNGSKLTEEYSLKRRTDTSITATAFLTYSKKKLRNIPYSFSRELDSIKGMKLFDVRVIYNPAYYKEQNASLGRIEIPHHVEEIDSINEAEIKKLFNFAKNFEHK